MKKALLSAVSVAALLTVGSAAHAMNNTQATDQDGSNNTSTVQQAGADNVAGDQARPNIQDGSDNIFFVDQVGDLNGVWSETSGSDPDGNPMAVGGALNQIITDGTLDTLNGNGSPNSAQFPGITGAFNGVLEDISRVRQVGNTNIAAVNSGNERNANSPRPVGQNFFNIRQTGNTNQVGGAPSSEQDVNAFSQSGEYNVLLADQQGNGNRVFGDSVGHRNTYAAVQLGNGNLLQGEQRGDDHKIVSYQAGGGNTAYVNQGGNGNIHTNIQGVSAPQPGN